MNRTEWLTWRKAGIGSSDASIIMGVSPWKTELELFNEKISNDIKEESSYIMDRGNEFEPKVRAMFELMHGRQYAPALCVSEECPFLRASLDGRNVETNTIIEIKLSGRADWDLAKNDKVPDKYMPQVQHQLMVSGATHCYFVSYLYTKGDSGVSAEKMAVVTVHPDMTYISKLLEKEIKFWECVTNKSPPTIGSGDFKEVSDLKKLAASWKRANKKLDTISEEIETLRMQIVAAAEKENHPKISCGDMKIQLTKGRAGSVDYQKIVNTYLPNLTKQQVEEYRKATGTPSWKITT